MAADDRAQAIIRQLQADPTSQPNFQWVDGYLLFKGRLYLPGNSTLIPLLLLEGHDGKVGGHSGVLKTYKRVAASVFWPGMKRDINEYVRNCQVCQQNKYQTLTPGGLLQPLPIPNRIWEDIAMDFIEGLPRSGKMNSILVVVDRLSKYGHFIGLKHPFTAGEVAGVFVKEVVRLHGTPLSIVSDRDKIFMSKFWAELFRLQRTKLHRSTAYHPQSDG